MIFLFPKWDMLIPWRVIFKIPIKLIKVLLWQEFGLEKPARMRMTSPDKEKEMVWGCQLFQDPNEPNYHPIIPRCENVSIIYLPTFTPPKTTQFCR